MQRGKLEDGEFPLRAVTSFRRRLPRRHPGSRDVGTRSEIGRQDKAESFTPRANDSAGTKRRYMATMPGLLAESRLSLGNHGANFTPTPRSRPGQIPQRTDEQGQLPSATRRARRGVGVTCVDHYFLEHEYRARKETLRLRLEEEFSIQAALWSAYTDPQRRVKHWVQCMAIANCRRFSSSADSSELAQLRKKVPDPEKRVRSRSPKKGAIKGASQANQPQ